MHTVGRLCLVSWMLLSKVKEI